MKSQRLLNATALTTLMAALAFPVCAADEVREELHQTYPLGPEGEVTLDNINGNVRILTWDKAEVKVDAIKHARKQEDLDAVRIEVEPKDGRLRIHTRYPDKDSKQSRNNSTSVEYTLTVPKLARLDKVSTVNGGIEIQDVGGKVDANSVNGSVKAAGLGGPVELSTVNGSVKATLTAVKQDVSLRSVNGSISLGLPPDANAELSASTVNGSVNSDFPIAGSRSSRAPGKHKLEGKLGEGGPAIKLSSVNGSVRLQRN